MDTADGIATRNWRRALLLAFSVAAVVVAASVAIVSNIGDGSRVSRKEFDESVFVAYPGAITIKDVFRKAESGRYIDGGRFSNPTELIRRYRLKEPIVSAAFDDWLVSKYPPDGWPTSRRFDNVRTSYTRTVGKRSQRIDITLFRDASGGAVQQYELIYAIY